MITCNYNYSAPNSIEETLSLIKGSENYKIIAGGSDVVPQLKFEVITPSVLIDLKNVKELKKVEIFDDRVEIGSMTTLSDIGENKQLTAIIPAIAEAARNTASPQIRNRGTIGGNILQARRCMYYNQTKKWREGLTVCFKVGGQKCIQIPKSPVCRAIYYSDVATALLAMDASAEVYTEEGLVVRKVRDIIDEHTKDKDNLYLIKKFIIPVDPECKLSKFIKYSLRGSIDFPIINFATKVTDNDIRIFVGAIATNIIELVDTEKYFEDNKGNIDKEKAFEIAVNEMSKKCELVREIGLSIDVKRKSFRLIDELIEDIIKILNK